MLTLNYQWRPLVSQALWNYFERGSLSEQVEDWIDSIYVDLETEDEPPAGGDVSNIVQVSYILPAGTQTGPVLELYQFNQLKFDTLVADTTGDAELVSPGGVILPAGNWLLDVRYHLFYPNAYFPVKITHAGDDIVFSDFYFTYATPLAIQHAVVSDGANPIRVWLNPGSSYVYAGYSTVYNIDRTVGTLAFIELP